MSIPPENVKCRLGRVVEKLRITALRLLLDQITQKKLHGGFDGSDLKELTSIPSEIIKKNQSFVVTSWGIEVFNSHKFTILR